MDTGVLVAAFAPWHEAHDLASAQLRGRPCVVAHALAETYSVLTRLPAPMRMSADVAAGLLLATDFGDVVTLDAMATRRLVAETFPVVGVVGGATYDALIGATVAAHDGILFTLDRRALTAYAKVGCNVELLAY